MGGAFLECALGAGGQWHWSAEKEGSGGSHRAQEAMGRSLVRATGRVREGERPDLTYSVRRSLGLLESGLSGQE